MNEPQLLAERYFTAWQAHDEPILNEILSEDVRFSGPMATVKGRQECIAGMLGMLEVITSIEVQARVADETDVTFYLLHTTAAPPTPTANWSHVENGRITEIRAAFDPRGILGK